MVHKDNSQREPSKTRGRPFPKGNKRGKLEYHVLDTSGHRGGIKGGVINPHAIKPQQDALKTEIEVIQKPKEEINMPQEKELIESLEFYNGDNVITVKFLKKSGRNFKVKVLLNDEIELKPISFITKTAAYDSWAMLKRMLKP